MHRASAGPTRIILDANILVSAVIAAGRASGSELGRTVDRALGGDVTVIVSLRLLAEVERALRSPRLARWVDGDQVPGAMRWIVGGRCRTCSSEFIRSRRSLLLCGRSRVPRSHEEMIPVAEDLYRSHLDELREEGLIR